MGETTTLAVGGMTCGGCAGNVQRALEAVAGVTAAAVDHVAGSASVAHAGVAQGELEAAVAAAGPHSSASGTISTRSSAPRVANQSHSAFSRVS